eukprot:364487-Chlamydomonas_euryale.AAC.34
MQPLTLLDHPSQPSTSERLPSPPDLATPALATGRGRRDGSPSRRRGLQRGGGREPAGLRHLWRAVRALVSPISLRCCLLRGASTFSSSPTAPLACAAVHQRC